MVVYGLWVPKYTILYINGHLHLFNSKYCPAGCWNFQYVESGEMFAFILRKEYRAVFALVDGKNLWHN